LVGNFLVFYQPIPKENLVGTFWYHKIGGSPFFPPKRKLWTPFGALSPPFEGKRVSRGFFQKNVPRNFKKEFPPNPTVQKIPTGYTNWLVLVPYRSSQTASIGMVNNAINLEEP
jgi:hypothetical protein